MPSGLAQGCCRFPRLAGKLIFLAEISLRKFRFPRVSGETAARQRQPGEGLGHAHDSTSLVRRRKSSASMPAWQWSSAPTSACAGHDDVAGTGLAQCGDQVAPPLVVRRVGAGQAGDRLAVVGLDHGRDAVGRAGRTRRRPRRRPAGWWPRWRGRCGRRPGPWSRGTPASRPGRRAAPRRRRPTGVRRRRRPAARAASSPRCGNSVSPVSGRVRWATSCVAAGGDLGHPARRTPRAPRTRSGRAPPTRRARARR